LPIFWDLADASSDFWTLMPLSLSIYLSLTSDFRKIQCFFIFTMTHLYTRGGWLMAPISDIPIFGLFWSEFRFTISDFLCIISI
jgi:hypothetical protein